MSSQEIGPIIGTVSVDDLARELLPKKLVRSIREVRFSVDNITQRQHQLEKIELENQIKLAAQRADQERQAASMKLELEVEGRRLELLERRLEVQKKGIQYALEIASQLVDTLLPSADQATKAKAMQALLPNLLQLESGKGLELALPEPQKAEKSTEEKEGGETGV